MSKKTSLKEKFASGILEVILETPPAQIIMLIILGIIGLGPQKKSKKRNKS